MTKTNETALLASVVQLLINASDSTKPEQKPIHLLLAQKTLLGPITGAQKTIPAGHYASLIITDQGRGIGDAVLPKIFDPFFSTKPLEQGGGMGLSVVIGFVQESTSYITLQSEQDQGTTFTLLFPETEPTASTA